LVGAANTTGAIAAGAAFQVFEKIPAAQPYIKYVVLVFLLGVFAQGSSLLLGQAHAARSLSITRAAAMPASRPTGTEIAPPQFRSQGVPAK
jgi:hypothetical protein